jgi:hypothetical protein
VIKLPFTEKQKLFKILTEMVDDKTVGQQAGIIINGCKNSFGCFFKVGKISLLFLNEGKYTLKTIRHELIHYFQRCCGIWLYDSKLQSILDGFDFTKISHIINVSDPDIIRLTLQEMIFNNREFLATIDNLKYSLQIFYDEKYNHMHFSDFLTLFINTFATDNKQVFQNNKLFNEWKELQLSKKDLDFFILAYILYGGKRSI